MSDEGTTPEAQDAPAQVEGGDKPEAFSAEYVAKLRNENAAWRAKLREAEAKLSEANKTPAVAPDDVKALREKVEQLESSMAEKEKQAATAQLELARQRIGAEMGLPAALIERLVGTDEDSIKADAEKLKAAIPETAQGRVIPGTKGMPSGQPQGKTREQHLKEIYGRG